MSYATYYVIDLTSDTVFAVIQSYYNLNLTEVKGYMASIYQSNYNDYYFYRDGISIAKVYLSEAGLATSMRFYGSSLKLDEAIVKAWKKSQAFYAEFDKQKENELAEKKRKEEETAEKYRNMTFILSSVTDQETIDDYVRELKKAVIEYYEKKAGMPYDVLRNSDVCYQEFYSLYNVTLITGFDTYGKPTKIKTYCNILDGDSSLFNALNDDIPVLPAFESEGFYIKTLHRFDSLTVNLFRGAIRIKTSP